MSIPPTYRPEIDGLRALAVLPVILFHANKDWLSGGYVGVDVFFVISGYLIAGIIAREIANGEFSLSNFYERRARRILPALLVVSFATIPFAYFWLSPADLKDHMQSLAAVAAFGSNILFWQESGYFDTTSELKSLLHTWSLAVEEQYYILFPLILVALSRSGTRAVVAGLTLILLISFLTAEYWIRHDEALAFYLLPTRAWELMVGALAALAITREQASPGNRVVTELGAILGATLIIVPTIVYDEYTPFPGWYALAPTLGAVLVLVMATPQTFIGRALSHQTFVSVGLLSYSAYLWHQPVFALARHSSITELSDLWMVILSILSLVLAYFSYRYVERPFRDKRRVDRGVIFSLSAIGLLGIFSIGVIGHFADGWPSRFAADTIALNDMALAHEQLRDDGGCNRTKQEVHLSGCVHGADVAPTIALIGDSHASTLVYELGVMLKQRNQSFVQHTKNGCPFSLNLVTSENRNCKEFFAAVLDDLGHRKIATVLVFSRWAHPLHDAEFTNGLGGVEPRSGVHYTVDGMAFDEPIDVRRAALIDGMRSAIGRLASRHQHVIVVGPVPVHGWDVPGTLAKIRRLRGDSHELPALPLAVFDARNAAVRNALASLHGRSGIDYVDAGAVFCLSSQGICPATEDGEVLYYDDDHLSNAGAKRLLTAIARVLVESPDGG